MKNFNDERTAKIKAYERAIEIGAVLTLGLKVIDYAKRSGRFNIYSILDQHPQYNYSSITSAISNLEDLGIVRKRKKTIKVFRPEEHEVSEFELIQEPAGQFLHAYNRRMKKFETWIKRGKTEFSDLIPKHKIGQLDIFKDV